MAFPLNRLANHTLVYSCGHIASRMMSFFLLPLTTRYLSPADYGVIGTLAIIPPLLDGLFSLGFGVSMGRSYWAEDGERERHGVVWTCAFATSINCLFWLVLAALFLRPLTEVVLPSTGCQVLVWFSLLNVALSNLGRPFIAWLQLEGRAKTFVGITLVQVIAWLSLTIYFVVGKEWAAWGVVVAAVMGQAIYLVLALAVAVPRLHFGLLWRHVPEMFRVGYPSIFGLSAYFIMQYSDRYMLQRLDNLEAVGFYSMSYNFGQVINLVVSGFLSAWPPFYHAYLKRQEEAKAQFGQLCSYYAAGMALICGGLFLFAKPVVTFMVHPSYHDVWKLVGVIALSQGLWGFYSIGAPGFIFARKTLYQGMLEISGAALNIGLNFLLIPSYGGAGAAVATLITFAGLTLASLSLSYRYLPIRYSWGTLAYIGASFLSMAGYSFISTPPLGAYCVGATVLFGANMMALWLWFKPLQGEQAACAE